MALIWKRTASIWVSEKWCAIVNDERGCLCVIHTHTHIEYRKCTSFSEMAHPQKSFLVEYSLEIEQFLLSVDMPEKKQQLGKKAIGNQI